MLLSSLFILSFAFIEKIRRKRHKLDSSRRYQLLPFVTIGQSRAPLATTSTLQTANAIMRTALTFIIGLWGRLDDCSDNTVNE